MRLTYNVLDKVILIKIIVAPHTRQQGAYFQQIKMDSANLPVLLPFSF